MLLSATTMNMYAIAGMLAPGGRCRTMDASADGYVRAEAAVMLHVAVRRGIGSIDLEGHTTGGAILAGERKSCAH